MRKIITIITLSLILLTGGLSAQTETWDILDKSMAAWNDDGGSNINMAWSYDSNNYGFLTPQPLTLAPNTHLCVV